MQTQRFAAVYNYNCVSIVVMLLLVIAYICLHAYMLLMCVENDSIEVYT